MIKTGHYDIEADRWVACIRTFSLVGVNLTGATFASQVRAKPDAGGAPLANLTTVGSASSEGVRLIYAGTDTVANHIAAGRLEGIPGGMTSASSIVISQIGFRINESTMEAMPFPAEVGDNAVFVWDMHITPSGGIKDKYFGGKFTVIGGATQ